MTNRRYPLDSKTDLLIMDAGAAHAGYGRYRRVALCKVVKGKTPARIDSRSRDMIEILSTWEHLSDGTTSRCAFYQGLEAAQNAAQEILSK